MAKPIYLIGGSKGGVGKTLITMAVIDYLQQREQPVLLIESDTSNPDVGKAYENSVSSELIDLDDADGWIELVNTCDREPDRAVVINTAARNNVGVSAYGVMLNSTLADLHRQLITLWVINRQRDSLELLLDYMDALPDSVVHVLRNAHFGDESKFELYNSSTAREQIEQHGGQSLNFPDLADRVADDLNRQRLTIAEALKTLPLGNRAELIRWRHAVAQVLDHVITHE